MKNYFCYQSLFLCSFLLFIAFDNLQMQKDAFLISNKGLVFLLSFSVFVYFFL